MSVTFDPGKALKLCGGKVTKVYLDTISVLALHCISGAILYFALNYIYLSDC